MFFVIDKSKIVSYVVALCTVVILFVAAANLQGMADNIIATSTNALSDGNSLNVISNETGAVKSENKTNSINNEVTNKVSSNEMAGDEASSSATNNVTDW